MPATVSGSKTCHTTLSPELTAAVLTSLMATPPELLTIKQLNQILDATKRIAGGGNPAAQLTSLLT